MKSISSLALVLGLVMSTGSFAQAPAGAPAGSTGVCKDGTYTTNDTKKGACSGHKGVKDWYGAAAAAPPAKAAATTTAAAPATTPAAAAKPAPTAPAKTNTASTTPAPGGGAGQVWVNTGTKVYHCPGTRYYGKTKEGQYMSESAAKAAGNHGDHGKGCTG